MTTVKKIIDKVKTRLIGVFLSKTSTDRSTQVPPYDESDVKKFIRDLNIESVLGNIDITPDINRLDMDTIMKCRKLTEMGFLIGGSVLLKACGLLNREPGDIDVFGDVDKSIDENIIKKNNIINSSRNYFDSTLRYKVKIDELGDVDIFQIDLNNPIESEGTEYGGIKFKELSSTIYHKLNYFRDKDILDFEYMKKKLNKEINGK